MHKALEIGLGALVGAIVPTVGAIYVIGGQANQIEQLERRVAALEQRPATPPTLSDPAKVQCARLAEQYASRGADRVALKDAMDALACFRAN